MPRLPVIDLNADVGEECGDDAALLGIVTSASVACGAHAGGTTVMRRTVEVAQRHSVCIGAHVSYPDREHFGRRDMDMPPAAITAEVQEQLASLARVAEAAGTRVRYMKAHGALYNRMARDAEVADAVLAAMHGFNPALLLLTLPDSIAMQRAAACGVTAVAEVFADRAYEDDGGLVSRGLAGAVLSDASKVAARMLHYVQQGDIESCSGRLLKFSARSICVHGDTPHATKLAQSVHDALTKAGIRLSAFA